MSQHDKALNKFFDEIIRNILKHVKFDVVKCVLLASPGFVKDLFFTYMINEANKGGEAKILLEHRAKFVLVHSRYMLTIVRELVTSIQFSFIHPKVIELKKALWLIIFEKAFQRDTS